MIWLIYLSLGFFLGLVIDTIWWETSINKYEKGVSAIEHFHWSIILLMLYLYTNASPLIGISLALLCSEWSEPFAKSEKHPFSLGSGHFLQSAIIGIVLIVILIAMVLL